jgi:hypothetical protein
MLAQADQRARRIKRLAASRMSIANTPTANQYFTNTIKILLPKNCGIINELLTSTFEVRDYTTSDAWIYCLGKHQMGEERFSSQELQTHIRCPCPILKHVRIVEISRTRSLINQRNDNFSAF